jgi:CheY-like chemotaxis protein
MVSEEKSRQNITPPDNFVEQVKDALEHLYDFPHLQNHPLINQLDLSDQSPESSIQQLRRELLEVIDTLDPGKTVPFRSPHARLYNILHLHYVEGLTVQETANELGISLRQAYRDLRKGEESVAAILWPRRQATPAAEPRAIRLSSIQAEMARLETNARPTDLGALLDQARKAVQPLARQHAVDFRVESPPEPVVVTTDPAVAQQVLVNMLSHIVKQAQPGPLPIALGTDQGRVFLTLQYDPQPETTRLAAVNPVVVHLLDRLGWEVMRDENDQSPRLVSIRMEAHGPTVLVIDDNEGLVELLGRYLTGHNCRVTAAGGGQEGLELAQTLLPDAIILDVMMPEMDGWEFLQRLRGLPHLVDTPVIICSVFNDPELAYSLGASANLPKPVGRRDVLEVLRRLGVV